MSRVDDLASAKDLAEAGELDAAWAKLNPWLEQDPDDALALLLASYVLEKSKHITVAFHLARRVTELQPNRYEGWNNYGRISDHLWDTELSERAYRRAIKEAVKPDHKADALVNLAALYINGGEFAKAETYCRQALIANPENRKAKANLGFCQLAARNWADGWGNYAASLGTDARKLVQYSNEPQWSGHPGQTVAIYGEQGLGDEISFASMIPDAIRDCHKVIIDCDKRLEGLFARSFPQAKVYGTRNDKTPFWDESDRDIDASIAMGELGGLYRRSPESFPGKPYLKACPDRMTMWNALFDAKGRPCIGIAWSGGAPHTGAKFRRWTLDDLLPIFNAVDAHWVCLEYKDASEEIAQFRAKHPEIDLVQYPYATLTKDYDDTAALVASLNYVISMQTAVIHLCGALGKKCDVFVAKTSQWRYGENETQMPWYDSVRLHRQAVRGHWANTIAEYAKTLSGRDLRASA